MILYHRRLPFGYTFCYAGLLGGPASEMRDYLQACEGSGASGEYNRKHGHAPTAGWLPLWLRLQSFGWAFAFQWGGAGSRRAHCTARVHRDAVMAPHSAVPYLYVFHACKVLFCLAHGGGHKLARRIRLRRR